MLIENVCLLLEQDSRITDYSNEAKDNVKYLYTLDKFFGPLVKCNPVSICIRFLIYAVYVILVCNTSKN